MKLVCVLYLWRFITRGKNKHTRRGGSRRERRVLIENIKFQEERQKKFIEECHKQRGASTQSQYKREYHHEMIVFSTKNDDSN
jgi:hypothetical protein